ncbi:hypothetical protein ACJX0J_006552, partial [Zea mays]
LSLVTIDLTCCWRQPHHDNYFTKWLVYMRFLVSEVSNTGEQHLCQYDNYPEKVIIISVTLLIFDIEFMGNIIQYPTSCLWLTWQLKDSWSRIVCHLTEKGPCVLDYVGI